MSVGATQSGQRFDVAVVGPTTLVGETLLALLAEREFPVGALHLLDRGAQAGGRVEFRDSYHRVLDIAGFDFAQVRLAFFCAGEQIAADHAPRAAASNCVVIDDSARFRLEPDVPLVVPEVNPHALAQYSKRGIIASPNTCATLLSVVLKPLHDAAGVERVNVATYQAVSGTGRQAVEELAAQTAALLNLKPVKAKAYPKQIAFNVLPRIGAVQDNGYTEEEMKMVWEMRKIMEDDRLLVNPTTVRVPVFHGHCEAAHIETRVKLTADAARALLAGASGVLVLDERERGGYPTPVTEAAGEDAVYVSRIREDISHPRGLDFWLVADNIRKGAALNCIQIAETLLQNHF